MNTTTQTTERQLHFDAKNIYRYYVSMTDKFMSGWGKAEGKINKYIVACDTYEQAETIKRNAEKRPEMKRINICINKPYFKPSVALCSWKHYNDLGEIWKKA